MEERDYTSDEPSETFDDEDTNPAKGTPPVDQSEGVEGQTQTGAPGDEAGVPPDEEMNRES
jgi:DNA replication initiation complex subunit (GINS family)